jgi:hypothetical protein
MAKRSKLIWSIVALAITAIAWSGHADNLGRTYAQETLTRALVTFAIARTLNGVISTAQGTELSLEPGGVGVNFHIGEILDPINDLIERFSVVMLVSTSSLGLQNVLLSMTAWWGLSALLSAAAIVALLTLWAPHSVPISARLAQRWLLIITLIRFAIPVLMITTTLVFNAFLAEEHAAATQALEQTGTELEEIAEQATPPEPQEDPSLVDQLGSMLDEGLRSLNARERIEQLRVQVTDAVEHIINLIVIFVFQTVLLPLAFLWFVVELGKSIVSRTAKL